MPSFEVTTPTPTATQALGERLGQLLQPGDLITLSGELGAGKTTLVGGIARGWGTQDIISSPTFVLVNEYRRPAGQSVWHLDCYRLNSGREALALGFEDLLETGGVMLIEWPERIAAVLPAERLEIQLRWLGETARQLSFTAHGERPTALLAALQTQLVNLG